MSTENIVKSFMQAVQNRNAEEVEKFFSEHITFENMPAGSVIKGKQAVYEEFKGFFQAASSIRWDIEREVYSGNIAMIERKNHVCFKGKDIVLPMVTIIEVVNDKITVFRDYFDSKSFEKQIG